MQLTINLSHREVDQSYVIGLEFVKILINSYITETETTMTNMYTIEHCKTIAFIITRYDPISGALDVIDELHVPIISSHDWPQFSIWCKDHKGVDLHIKKKLRDNEAIWWPFIIELLVDNDNEHLFMAKLRDM